jgi:hypothetical protein
MATFCVDSADLFEVEDMAGKGAFGPTAKQLYRAYDADILLV